MISFDNVTKENINKYNPNWAQIPDNPYRTFIIGGFGSGKTNELLNLIKQKYDNDYSIIDKIYLHIKGKNENKFQYIVKKCEKIVLKI